MSKYKVKFADGFVLSFDRKPSPSEIEEAYNSTRGNDVAKTDALSGRRDLGRDFVDELNYNPMQNDKIGLIQKVLQTQTKPLVTAAKGYGALRQRMESAVANPMIHMQQGENQNPIEIAKQMLQGATTEPTNQLGDLPRNAGVDPTVSAGLGLAAESLIPDPVNLIGKAISPAREAAMKVAAKARQKSLGGLMSAQSKMLMGVPERAADRMISQNFSPVKIGESTRQAGARLDEAIQAVTKAGTHSLKSAGRLIRKQLSKHGDELISGGDETGVAFTRAGRNVLDSSGAFATEAGSEAIAGGTKSVSQLDVLMSRIEQVAQSKGGKLTINDIKAFQKEIYPLMSKSGPTQAAASALYGDLADKIVQSGIGGAKLAEATNLYRQRALLFHGNPDTLSPSLEKLATGNVAGRSPMEGLYSTLKPKVEDALVKLEGQVPKKYKFVDNLRDAVANSEYGDWFANKTLSAFGAGTAIVKPDLLKAVAAFLGASSPRGNAVVQKLLNASRSKFAGSPASGALSRIIDQFFLDPAIRTGATRRDVMDEQGL